MQMSIEDLQAILDYVQSASEPDYMCPISFMPYVITIMIAVLTSSGLWMFINKKLEKKDNKTKLLLGLTHDRVFYLGTKYINRGWITRDEMDNLRKHLASPYYKLGGNGIVKEIVDRCLKLPIKRVEDLTIEDLQLIAGATPAQSIELIAYEGGEGL